MATKTEINFTINKILKGEHNEIPTLLVQWCEFKNHIVPTPIQMDKLIMMINVRMFNINSLINEIINELKLSKLYNKNGELISLYISPE